MTVRELRDRLNEIIAKDESYGDAPVYYDDAELNLEPISAEEVHVVQAIQQPNFRHDSLKPGNVFCSLNINRYDCEELEYWTGGAIVIPPDFLKNRREEVMRYIAEEIAGEVFKFNFAIEMDKRFRGVQYTDEVKESLKIYRERFVEKIEEEFYQKWFDNLSSVFVPQDIKKILKMAKITTLEISLSGDREDTIPF